MKKTNQSPFSGFQCGRHGQVRPLPRPFAPILGALSLVAAMMVAQTAKADDEDIRVRFLRPAPLRQTVSINTTNVGVFTNDFSMSTNILAPVTITVSNLPPNCGYDLATNGVSVGTSISLTNDVGLSVTLFSTNVPQGEYTFYLWATGGGTNYLPLVLQSCYVWLGVGPNITNGFNTNAFWTNATSWVGGNNPGANSGNTVFFGDLGAQTNKLGNQAFTNILVDVNTTVGTLRFGPGTFSNELTTNALYHTLRINNNSTLTITNSFVMMRDYLARFSGWNRDTAFDISGGNGAKLVVSNAAGTATFANLLDNAGSFSSSLSMTNIGLFVAHVNRMGLGDYRMFPNYRALNEDTNDLGGTPQQLLNSIYLARTNFITALYKDPDNYLNENTRQYGITWLNGEIRGNGSSQSGFFALGQTNNFKADSICFVGANHASGNNGAVRFAPSFDNNCLAIFRNTNGTSRMSLFAIADGGGTNDAGSNLKGTVDLSTIIGGGGVARNGICDLLADKLIIARDRSSILLSNSVNYQGTLIAGRGNWDVNTVILGYQEHQVRRNENNNENQLGYCQGTLVVTNQGVFRVNGNLTLGYTTDTNDVTFAGLFNNRGRITVEGATLMVSNIVVDGGPRNYSDSEGTPRQDSITLVGANLIVSNSIGNAPGRPLNSFSTQSSTNTFFVAGGRTNLICRELATPGPFASVIKVAGLSSIGALPATLPIISYANASSPNLQADLSSFPGTNGYLLNDTVNSNISLYLTTNAPKILIWVGNVSSNWDYTTPNWKISGTSTATNFGIGDVAIFDDTSSVTNVFVVDSVVPGQAGYGVTFSNSVKSYTISGGIVAGTSSLLKVGAGSLTFDATKQGPLTILGGSFDVAPAGNVGLTTVASNVAVNVYGSISGGLTSTGTVAIAVGGKLFGGTTLAAGWLDNAGTINTAPGAFSMAPTSEVVITNRLGATLTIGAPTANTILQTNCVLANFGTITNLNRRLEVAGFMYGTGVVTDPDGTAGGGGQFSAGVDGRLLINNPTGILSPGAAPSNSIGTVNVYTRFDFFAANNAGWGTLLIEVDKANPQTNDMIVADYWSDQRGKIIMKNIGASPFADGDFFRVVANSVNVNDPIIPDNLLGELPTVEPAIPGPGLQWDMSDFRLYGVIKVAAHSLVWRGNVNTNWDDGVTANWLGGLTYTNSQGALFDDTANGFTVSVLTNVAPAGWMRSTNFDQFGVSNGVVYFTNIVVGVSTNISTNIVQFTTNSAARMPGVVVNNTNNYIFTGPGTIEGFTGLYKTGPGTLTFVNMSNLYVGPTVIEQGVIAVPYFTNGGVASPLGTPTLTGARNPNGAERLILNGGTLRFTGPTMSSDRGMTVNSGNGTLEVSNAAANLTLTSGPLRGPGALTKTGLGTLTLLNSGSTISNLIVSAGRVTLGQSAGVGNVSLPNAGVVLGFTNNVSLPNDLDIGANVIFDNTNFTILRGEWSGSGNVTISNASPGVLAFNNAMTNYSGNITFVGAGTNRFNVGTNNFKARGSAATVFDLGASARLDNLTGGITNGPITYDLGGLAGGAGAVLAGRFTNDVLTASNSIYSIGAKGVDTTFAGSIVDGVSGGTVSVVKVGSGKLTLDGVNTFTGSLVVSNGTLGGNGVISGPLTVVATGTLAPGSSPGRLTVSNNATLSGITLMELTPATNDQLRVTGTLTGGGTLIVTNIGGTLYNGTTYRLFAVGPAGTGAATGFGSPTLPAGYTWTDNIAVDGTITVASGGAVNPNPTTLNTSLSGSTLTLSWPASHIGWTLQTQTNTLSVGLTVPTNTWYDVSGSATTNSVAIAIDPLNPTVFFRMRLVAP